MRVIVCACVCVCARACARVSGCVHRRARAHAMWWLWRWWSVNRGEVQLVTADSWPHVHDAPTRRGATSDCSLVASCARRIHPRAHRFLVLVGHPQPRIRALPAAVAAGQLLAPQRRRALEYEGQGDQCHMAQPSASSQHAALPGLSLHAPLRSLRSRPCGRFAAMIFSEHTSVPDCLQMGRFARVSTCRLTRTPPCSDDTHSVYSVFRRHTASGHEQITRCPGTQGPGASGRGGARPAVPGEPGEDSSGATVGV